MLWSCEFVARFIKYTCQTSVIVIPYHYNGKINKNDTMHFVRGTAICNRRTLFLSRFRCVLLDGLLQDFIAVLFYCGRYSTYRVPILGRHYFHTIAKQLPSYRRKNGAPDIVMRVRRSGVTDRFV
jgi:hypothetical protein